MKELELTESQSLTSNWINGYTLLAATMSLSTKIDTNNNPESPIITYVITSYWLRSNFYLKVNTGKLTHQCNSTASCLQKYCLLANPQSFTTAITEPNIGFQSTLQQLSNSQQLCNVCYFANSELYELFWIAENYSVETELSADGDKWAWLNSPSPAEETELLAHAQGSGRCREGDTQWRGDVP